jgi:coenzyme PQQ precursor peptide PqqA
MKRATKKTWSKPQVEEQQIGMEVSSYLPAELDAR